MVAEVSRMDLQDFRPILANMALLRQMSIQFPLVSDLEILVDATREGGCLRSILAKTVLLMQAWMPEVRSLITFRSIPETTELPQVLDLAIPVRELLGSILTTQAMSMPMLVSVPDTLSILVTIMDMPISARKLKTNSSFRQLHLTAIRS